MPAGVLLEKSNNVGHTTERLVIGYYGLRMLKVISNHQEEGLTKQELAEKLINPQGKSIISQDMFKRTLSRLQNWERIVATSSTDKWRCTDLGLNHIGKGKKSLQDQNSAVK